MGDDMGVRIFAQLIQKLKYFVEIADCFIWAVFEFLDGKVGIPILSDG